MQHKIISRSCPQLASDVTWLSGVGRTKVRVKAWEQMRREGMKMSLFGSKRVKENAEEVRPAEQGFHRTLWATITAGAEHAGRWLSLIGEKAVKAEKKKAKGGREGYGVKWRRKRERTAKPSGVQRKQNTEAHLWHHLCFCMWGFN